MSSLKVTKVSASYLQPFGNGKNLRGASEATLLPTPPTIRLRSREAMTSYLLLIVLICYSSLNGLMKGPFITIFFAIFVIPATCRHTRVRQIFGYDSDCCIIRDWLSNNNGRSSEAEPKVTQSPQFEGCGPVVLLFVGWKPLRPVRTIAGLRDIG